MTSGSSVPARLGKGQGAKEIGHNLAREQPEFGHNLVRNDTKSGTFLRVNDQNLVLWAIDENMGTNLQALCRHFYIGCLKTQKKQLHCKNKKIYKKIVINFFFVCVVSGGRRGLFLRREAWPAARRAPRPRRRQRPPCRREHGRRRQALLAPVDVLVRRHTVAPQRHYFCSCSLFCVICWHVKLSVGVILTLVR